jgi:tRNA U34 5-carboxymethylaminomethyl modifying GTPase MnmE/TrmE
LNSKTDELLLKNQAFEQEKFEWLELEKKYLQTIKKLEGEQQALLKDLQTERDERNKSDIQQAEKQKVERELNQIKKELETFIKENPRGSITASGLKRMLVNST